MAVKETYDPKDYGSKEEKMMIKYRLQKNDAKLYFEGTIKPQLDRAYKLYMSYTGDRAKEIKSWQANIFVPYTQAVVETLMPRVLDARPDFSVQGRTEADQLSAVKVQYLHDYTWEISQMDDSTEDVVRSSMIFGTGYYQIGWKKDEREQEFFSGKDINSQKYVWKKKKQIFYDAPHAERVSNYDLWYDWHNIPRKSKQYWFRRMILVGEEIKRRFPMYDKKRLKQAFASSGDLTDYESVRQEIERTHTKITKTTNSSSSANLDIYSSQADPDLKMHEVFIWWRPFDDAYAVMVNDVPILKGGVTPIIFDFKEAPIVEIPYLRFPGKFEGIGLPIILENPQMMLNTIKNQRLDATILSIHKMWIVNPLANVNIDELVVRPFGIIHTPDPQGVREVQFSDIKPSSYQEEELLKSDMRYASGVDDFSMGSGGSAGSATEVRHLRESTLERVRLFINHIGSGLSVIQGMWTSMYRQFFTKQMTIRVIGEDGAEMFPLIEKDDLMGQYDYRATVIPSIAGKSDIDKKQGMDLFQLLVQLPFIDPKKLTSKVLHPFNWSLDSIVSQDQPQPPIDPNADPAAAGMLPGMPIPGMPGVPVPQDPNAPPEQITPETSGPSALSPAVLQAALKMLGGKSSVKQGSPFAEAGAPINLLNSGAMPPTPPGVGAGMGAGLGNTRGMNRKLGGRVNTNIPTGKTSSGESSLLGRAANIQR